MSRNGFRSACSFIDDGSCPAGPNAGVIAITQAGRTVLASISNLGCVWSDGEISSVESPVSTVPADSPTAEDTQVATEQRSRSEEFGNLQIVICLTKTLDNNTECAHRSEGGLALQEGLPVLDYSRLDHFHAGDNARGGAAPPFRCVSTLLSMPLSAAEMCAW